MKIALFACGPFRVFLSLLCLLGIFLFANLAQADITTGLRFHADFESPNPLHDKSTYSHNGTAHNGASLVSGGGVVNSDCYTFDGTNDYVSFINTNFSGGNDHKSLSGWFKVNQLPTVNVAFWGYGSGNNNQLQDFRLGITPNGATGVMYNGGGLYSANNSFQLGTWNHVVATFAGGTNGVVKLYLNGVEVAQENRTLNPFIWNVVAGRYYDDPGYYFKGEVDELRHYARELSASDVLELYNLHTPQEKGVLIRIASVFGDELVGFLGLIFFLLLAKFFRKNMVFSATLLACSFMLIGLNKLGAVTILKQAEHHDAQSGITTYATSIGGIHNGDWIRYDNVNLSSGVNTLKISYGTPLTGASLEVRVGSLTGTLAGSMNLASTGAWNPATHASTSINSISGTQTVYFKFTGNSFDLDWVEFSYVPPIPNDPSNIQASAISTSAIQVTWTDNSNNEDAFELEWKLSSDADDPANWTTVALAANASSYDHNTGLTPGALYDYKVRAKINPSNYSNFISTNSVLLPTTAVDFPYSTGFESGDFSLGSDITPLEHIAGTSSITGSVFKTGAQALSLAGGASTEIQANILGAGSESKVHIDYYIKPSLVDIASLSSSNIHEGPTQVAFSYDGSDGIIYALDGDGTGAGAGTWVQQPLFFDRVGYSSQEWLRLSYEIDYTAKTWDLLVNGLPMALNLGFDDDSITSLTDLSLINDSSADLVIDNLDISNSLGLFDDTDSDNLLDSWENFYFSNLTHDGTTDYDGDGLTNQQEFDMITNPSSIDTDADGIDDKLESDLGWEPRWADPVVDIEYLGNGEYGYETGFESVEGFTLAALNDQQEWRGQGNADIVSTSVNGSTSNAIELKESSVSQEDSIAEVFVSARNYLDLWITFDGNLVAGPLEQPANNGAGYTALFQINDSNYVSVFNGTTDAWVDTAKLIPVGTWANYAIHLDYVNKRWDLYVDNNLVAFAIPFADDTIAYMRQLSLVKLYDETSNSTFFDNIKISTIQPGSVNDDTDGDNLTDSKEYALGTDLLNSDTDGDGLSDGWEYANGLDPLIDEGATNDTRSSLFSVGPTLFFDRNNPVDLPGTLSIPSEAGITSGDLTFEWTVLREPSASAVTITDTSLMNSAVSFSETGIYKLKLTLANDANYKPYDELVIFVSDQAASDYNYLIGEWGFDEDLVEVVAQESEGDVWLEAEWGNMGSWLETVSDGNASNSSYIRAKSGAPEGPLDNNPPTDASEYITYKFNITAAGTYKIWGRTIAPSIYDDSFWVQVDDGAWVTWNQIQPSTVWSWDEVHDALNGNSIMTYTLNAGVHTLRIGYREGGTYLDKIFITSNATTPSGTGSVAGNALDLSVAQDASQWQSEGTVVEASRDNGQGWNGSAMDFVGDDLDDAVSVDQGQDLLNGLESMTLLAWVYADENYTDDGFFTGYPGPGGDNHFNIRYDAEGWQGGQTRVIRANMKTTKGNNVYESIGNQTPSGEWFHIALVYDQSGITFYRNGQLLGASYLASYGGLIDGMTQFVIGQGEVAGKSWNGKVDEVKLFGKAFTADEVNDHFLDGDFDGMPDSFEKIIIDFSTSDDVKIFADVNPGDDIDGDGFTNLEEYELGLSPVVYDPKIVSGVINNVSDSSWTTVTLPHTYTNMVVLATPVYSNTEQPAIARVRNATGNSFEVKLNSPVQQNLTENFDKGVAWYQMNNNGNDTQGAGPNIANSGLSYSSDTPAEGTHSLRSNDEWDKFATVADNSMFDPGTGDFAITGWIKSENSRWPLDKGRFRQTNNANGYDLITTRQAESYDSMSGVQNLGWKVGYIDNGDWVGFNNVNMGSGVDMVRIRFGSPVGSGGIEIRDGSATGNQLAYMPIWNSGSWDPNAINVAFFNKITGTKNIYLKFTGQMDVDWIEFGYNGHSEGFGYNLSTYSGLSFEMKNGHSTASVGKGLQSGWNFFTLNMDRDGDMKMFINGSSAPGATDISSWNGQNLTNDMDMFLGKAYWNHWKYFWEGNLDNVRFYDRLLKPAEIDLLYSQNTPSEISYTKENITDYSIHYFVIEEGVYTEAQHGFKAEAKRISSTVTDSDSSWAGEAFNYGQSYTTPVVLGQVITENDAEPSVFWCNDATTSTVDIGKHVGEDSATSRLNETIGIVILEQGADTFGSTEFTTGNGSQIVRSADDSAPYTYGISGLTAGAEVALLTRAGNANTEGCWPVLYENAGLSSTELKLFMDEDRMSDSERSGPAEAVSYLVIGQSQDWLNLDNDLDKIPDYWERQIIHADSNDAINGFVDVKPNDDYDNDGLRNILEFILGTDPVDADKDTDNDGTEDADEYYANTSPKDDQEHPDSTPSGTPPILNNWEVKSLNLDANRPAKAFGEGSELRIASTGDGPSSNDSLGFYSQQISGNFTLIAQVKDFAQIDADVVSSSIGLMVRSGVAGNDAFASINVNSDKEYHFTYRPYDNWSYENIRSYGNEQDFPNSYLRMDKVGDRIYVSRSSDNFTWFAAGEAIVDLPSTFELGFYVHSGSAQYYARGAVEILSLVIDTDGDGISDHQEDNEYGTDKNLVDTDGDGFSDALEINVLFTDPNINDLTGGYQISENSTPILDLTVASHTSNHDINGDNDSWITDNGAIYSHDIRGWVEYGLTYTSAGMHRLDVEISQAGSLESNDYTLGMFINGKLVDRQTIEITGSSTAIVSSYLPYLNAATHTLRIQWLEGQPKTALKLHSVKVVELDGIDVSPSNGIPDWVENRLANLSYLDEVSVNTQYSPYTLEGKSDFLGGLTITGHEQSNSSNTINPAPVAEESLDGFYYSNIPLFDTDTTDIDVSDQFGALTYTKPVTLTNTLVQDQQQYLIPKGGKMILKLSDTQVGDLTIKDHSNGATITSQASMPAGSTYVYTFTGDNGGPVETYRIESTISGNTVSMTVKLIEVDLGNESPATVMGFPRSWTPVKLPAEVVFETDTGASLTESIPVQDPRTFTLSVGSSQPQAILARIDLDGDGEVDPGEPIIGRTVARGITQDIQRQTRMTVIAINDDGSLLVEASLHLDYVPADLEITLDIVRGGVYFDDATLTRTVVFNDFDNLGNYTYRMLMVGAIDGGLCHEITFKQDGVTIAE